MDIMSDNFTTAIDERLQGALEFSNYLSTLNRQKENAKLRLQNSLTYSKNGGIFAVNTGLISFIYALVSTGKKKSIILDINENAIPVDNLKDFYDAIVDIYYASMNEYMAECQSFKQGRTVKTLTGV